MNFVFLVLLLVNINYGLKATYKLTMDRLEVIHQNTSILAVEGKVDYFNKTTRCLYANFTIFEPVPRRAKVRTYKIFFFFP